MKKKFEYEYARAALTVDCVVFGLDDDCLKVMLIERAIEPFRGSWALPGGFVNVGESLDEAAERELREETWLMEVFLEQLYTFGKPERDPREQVVSVAYYALTNLMGHDVEASTDAANAAWFAVDELPELAFDHDEIVEMALQRLKGKVRYQPVGFELLPKQFTLTQIQKMYEMILERVMDKRNFRKKVLKLGVLKDTNEVQKDVSHRAAKLYEFDEVAYRKLEKAGINFEV